MMVLVFGCSFARLDHAAYLGKVFSQRSGNPSELGAQERDGGLKAFARLGELGGGGRGVLVFRRRRGRAAIAVG
jgi:hypothetical protein